MRANMRHYSIWPGNYAIIIPPQLREHLIGSGWSKADVANFIFERARIRRSEWADVGKGAVFETVGIWNTRLWNQPISCWLLPRAALLAGLER